jgi:anti-sigma factor RsiW
MDCKQARALLSAHVDAELGVSESMALEIHLDTCPMCRAQLAEQAEVRRQVRLEANYFRAPAHLENRINASLPQPTAEKQRRVRLPWNWLQLAPSLAGVFALAWGLNLSFNRPSPDDAIAQEVIASHVRSLMSSRVTDVESSDQHTVKPWFSGKLDYAPTVRDFTAQGFPLVGGRLDYVGSRSVATLIYRHRQHLIAIYQWPGNARQATSPEAQSRQGYHLIKWSDRRVIHWVISDLDPKELMALVEMLRAP